MKYYLIGLPGSGKSTIGRELAHELNFKFVDTDRLIEKKYGNISKIFNEHGESYFRDIETETLKGLMDLDDVVISCGGGIVEREINKEYMNGIVVYLDASLKEINSRLTNDSSRPLMATNSVMDLYKRRHQKYDSFKSFRIKNQIISKAIKDIKKETLKRCKKNKF
ncbi:MAG: shikimate kinase [Acholeplasmatales bacterium]|nr:shikimate kinase [Acholeplasmatales bacterium]